MESKPKAPAEPAGIDCEKCGKPMVIRSGRRGKFIACSGFPRCRNTKPLPEGDEKGKGEWVLEMDCRDTEGTIIAKSTCHYYIKKMT